MKFLVPLMAVLAAVHCMPQGFSRNIDPNTGLPVVAPSREPTKEELAQNLDAQYQFSANVEDHINDLSQQRAEVRDGLNVKGMYSYSDGYFKRTIHYEADEKGYRVVGEEVIPLDGPKVDLSGRASVSTAAHGTQLKYTVQSVPADGPISKVVEHP